MREMGLSARQGRQRAPRTTDSRHDHLVAPNLLERNLLEIVDDRYDKGSLLITSQVPIPRWHEVIGDMTLGDAILDRVVHRAHRLELKGASLRKRRTAPDALTADASE